MATLTKLAFLFAAILALVAAWLRTESQTGKRRRSGAPTDRWFALGIAGSAVSACGLLAAIILGNMMHLSNVVTTLVLPLAAPVLLVGSIALMGIVIRRGGR